MSLLQKKKLFFFLFSWQKNDKTSLELIEVPVKDLTFDQLQLLKVKTWNETEPPHPVLTCHAILLKTISQEADF